MPPETRQTDFETSLLPLWVRAQSGDEAAYRESLGCIAARVRGYVRRRLQGLPDDVEDVVQEILLAVHLHRGTYDPAVPVSAWVLAIARHKLVDLWRRRGRREDLHDDLDSADESAMARRDATRGPGATCTNCCRPCPRHNVTPSC